MSSNYIDVVLHLRYQHSLLMSAMKRKEKFKVSARSSHIRFDETKPSIEITTITEPNTGLSIGDYVTMHDVLFAPWSADGEGYYGRNHVSGENIYIVAFVTLAGKCGNASTPGTFAVLSKEMDGAGSNPSSFIMDREKQDCIALYFVQALEKVPPKSENQELLALVSKKVKNMCVLKLLRKYQRKWKYQRNLNIKTLFTQLSKKVANLRT